MGRIVSLYKGNAQKASVECLIMVSVLTALLLVKRTLTKACLSGSSQETEMTRYFNQENLVKGIGYTDVGELTKPERSTK